MEPPPSSSLPQKKLPNQKKIAKKSLQVSMKAKRFAKREAVRKQPFITRRKTSFKQVLFDSVKKIPWWLMSLCFHGIVLIFLAHIFLDLMIPSAMVPLKISWESVTIPIKAESPAEAKQIDIGEEQEKEEKEEAKIEVIPKEEPVEKEEPPVEETPVAVIPKKTITQPKPFTLPIPFRNRSLKGKKASLEKYGGSAYTEAAVQRGLEWLSKHQSRNGSWSNSGYLERCLGEPCDEKGSYTNHVTGLTGLVLLCFLGAGETPASGKYQKNVKQGIKFLLKKQGDDGVFGPGTPDNYNQAVACLSLIEAYAITGNPKLKEAGEKSLRYLASIQQNGGGWDYYDLQKGRNDTSITGWVVMAMKSAKQANLKFSEESWRKAKSFIHCMYNGRGSFYYSNEDKKTGAGMAGVGGLCLLYFGEKRNSLKLTSTIRLLQNYPPDWRLLLKMHYLPPENKEIYNNTFYAWYYGSLVLFQYGGPAWFKWNNKMKHTLLEHQEKEGCKDGSWPPAEAFFSSDFGGRLYATALNVLNLEIYYRYLPLYEYVNPVERKTILAEDQKNFLAAKEILERDEGKSKVLALVKLEKVFDEELRKEAVKMVCLLLKDKNITVRWKAIQSLKKFEDPAAIPFLKKAYFSKKNSTLKGYILDTILVFYHPDVLRFLIVVLKEKKVSLKRKAHLALKKRTGQNIGSSSKEWRRWWKENSPVKK